MGFCTTTFEPENALRENLSSVSKSASREIFSSNRNRTYQIERNPLETQQEKLNRTYKTASGRSSWLGRDPIEEWGGINLYAFVGNDGINEADYLGLFIWYTSELAAATSAGNKSKTMGEEWDADNSELVTKHNKQAMFKFSGMEYCGRICMKCYAADESLQNSSLPDEYKKTVYFYSYTGPVRGTLPSDVDAGNKKKFDAYQKKLEAFKERIKKYEEEYKTNNPGKAIPIPDWQPEPPEYAGASCQPLNAPPCSTLGEGWEDISYYHSHPSNNGFSEGDKNFAKALGKALWVTRGPRGKPGKWITEKTGG